MIPARRGNGFPSPLGGRKTDFFLIREMSGNRVNAVKDYIMTVLR